MQQSLSQNGTTVASYTWLANGTKCGVVDNNNKGYDYTGSLIYSRSGSVRTPESIENGAGRIIYSGGTYNSHYYITDHLGSTRVITDNSGNVVERDDYYPFGGQLTISTYPQLSVNRFKFNGKELQTTGNTGFLDYGARMYDPVLGRFHSVDPLGELMPSINPYHYCYNTPVVMTDPTGMLPCYESNYIGATYVDPSGKILKVTNDNDLNIYLVHDPENWDGTSNDGLLSFGQTPEDNTLAGFEGQYIYSERVVNHIFNEAERLGKQNDTRLSWIGLAHLNEFAQLMRSKEKQLKLLAEMKNLEKKKAMLLLQMLKNNELMQSDIQRRRKGFTNWLAGRLIMRTLLGLYANVDLPGDEAADYLFPDSILDKTNREFDAKNSQIIKKYDDMMKSLQKR